LIVEIISKVIRALEAEQQMKYLILLLVFFSLPGWGAAREIDDHHWEGVERIVAIGDIHGDYEHYMATLKAAGLIDESGKWAGGETHLVQIGDIPDRGPDTIRIIEQLQKLTREATIKSGRVHSLIGNHEAMNVYGDLRYVVPGEYQAFVNKNSAALRDRYYSALMQDLQNRDPAAFAVLIADSRETWDRDHPLGWVEHRQAWSPAWNPKAEFGLWVMSQKVAIQLNENLFVHGGISGKYCQNSLKSMTDGVVDRLKAFDPANSGILDDEYGPLWYRGLAGVAPEAPVESVQAVLDFNKAARIVIGHTPTSGIIWPRYDGRVIQIDTGISAVYGGHVAYLEITTEGLYAGFPNGKVKLPTNSGGLLPYVEQVVALDPENAHLKTLREQMSAQAKDSPGAAIGDVVDRGAQAVDSAAAAEENKQGVAYTPPICGISE
jgi:Calcineurin-like phosphoesterase